MPIGERFCLSFSLLRLAQKMEFSPHTVGLLFPSKTLSEPRAAATGTTVLQISWCGGCFPLSTLVSACLQLAPLLHFPPLPSLQISHMGNQDGDVCWFSSALGTARSSVLSQDRQLWWPIWGGGSPPPHPRKWQLARDARDNIRGDAWESKKRAWHMDRGGEDIGRAQALTHWVTRSGRSRHRVKTGLQDQTLLGRGQSSACLSPEMETQGLPSAPLQSSRQCYGPLSDSSL